MHASMLPAGWAEALDPGSGNAYYFNHDTGEVSWTKPKAVSSGQFGASNPMHTPESGHAHDSTKSSPLSSAPSQIRLVTPNSRVSVAGGGAAHTSTSHQVTRRKKISLVALLAVVALGAIILAKPELAPWSSPAAPTSNPAAPVARLGDTLAPGSTYSVPRSEAGEVLKLARHSAASHWPTPCARSYDGFGWEVVQPRLGHPDGLVHVLSCSSSLCEIQIPNDREHAYVLSSHTVPATRHDERDRAAAHLLIQGSFGPTRADIALLQSSGEPAAAHAAWVFDQLKQKPSLHRERYRRHANPRLDVVSEVGRPRGACEPFSRWNRIAIRGDDVAQNITFTEIGGITAMYVGGVLRSEVNMSELRPFGLGAPQSKPGISENCNWCQAGALSLDTTYTICRAQEWPMGKVDIGTRCTGQLGNTVENKVELFNSLLRFDHLAFPPTDRLGEATEVFELGVGDATLHALPTTRFNTGVLVLSINVACPFSLGAQVRPSTAIKHAGEYFVYDPRVLLLDNTVDQPAHLSSLSTNGHMRSCPLLDVSAPKTALNEHSCVVSHGCKPDVFTNTTFELNEITLRFFFRQVIQPSHARSRLFMSRSIAQSGDQN